MKRTIYNNFNMELSTAYNRSLAEGRLNDSLMYLEGLILIAFAEGRFNDAETLISTMFHINERIMGGGGHGGGSL